MNRLISLTEALNISEKTAGLQCLFTNTAQHTADTTGKSRCIGNPKNKKRFKSAIYRKNPYKSRI